MKFGLLGPLRVEDDHGELHVSSAMVRTVLAVLLLNANRVVSANVLQTALWGDRQPASARASLQNHVAKLRRQLGPQGRNLVLSADSGYLIKAKPGELDIEDFSSGAQRAREARLAGHWEKVAREGARALGLWRGQPFEDLPTGLWSEEATEVLQITRLELLEWRFDAELLLGQHQGLVGELAHWAALHPFREDFQRQLMLALHLGNRRAEALETYQRLRRRLSDELGIEPTPDVHKAYLKILRDSYEPGTPPTVAPLSGAPATMVPVPSTRTDGPDQPVPLVDRAAPEPTPVCAGRSGRLPSDTRVFTGRAEGLDWLLTLGRRAGEGSAAGMALVVAIDGMAGVGKTALAVHAAHQLKEEFPDGRFYIDLHGHTPGVEPLTAVDALGHLLRELGVPSALMPRDPSAWAAEFRNRLAGSRTLLVLDNAAGSAEIRQMLPSEPGCLVLVTSRRRLTGLDDAHLLTLEPLPETDAVALLHAVAGPQRIPADSPSTAELAMLCGSMPLTLRIAASRLRQHRSLPIEEIVAELRDEHGRLSSLSGNGTDSGPTVETVFASSLAALPASEQRLFRLLGLVPGPNFDATAVAWLLGDSPRTARYQLESLLDHSLLQEHSVGRYRFHDLVRLFARSLAASPSGSHSDTETASAQVRLLDYYLRGARAADRLLSRRTAPEPPLPPVPAPLPVADPHDSESAIAWWRTNWENIWACANDARMTSGRADAAAGFSSAVTAFAHREGHWSQAATLHQRALEQARDRGDLAAEAAALTELGRTRLLQGAILAAQEVHQQALPLCRALGDRLSEADALWELGRTHYMVNNHESAVELHRQALTLYSDLGSARGEANAMWALARSLHRLGDLDGAATYGQQALIRYRQIDDRLGMANGLWDLGRVADMRGDFEEALTLLEEVLGAYEELGSRVGVANALNGLGRTLRRMGKLHDAAERLEAALALYEELSEPNGITMSRHDLGLVRWEQGDLDEATRLLTLVSDAYQAYPELLGAARSLHELAQVRRDAQDYAASARLLGEALDYSREAGNVERTEEIMRHAKEFAAEAAAAFPTA